MDKPVEELMTAVGALGEVCGMFYKQLIKQGFTAEQALRLVQTYITTSFQGGKK